MSGFTDVKQKKFKYLLKWLVNDKGVEVKQGGRHNIRNIENGKMGSGAI